MYVMYLIINEQDSDKDSESRKSKLKLNKFNVESNKCRVK